MPHARRRRGSAAARAASVKHAFDQDALALAEQSAGIGVWSIDLITGLARGTAQFFRIMGLEPTDEPFPIERIRALRHPDDGDRVLSGFRQALEDGTDAYEIEYRIIRSDGSLRWIFGRGKVVRNAAGKPIRYSGIDLDITDRKLAEAALAAAKEELERMNVVLEQRVRERTAELQVEARRRTDVENRLHQAQKMEAVGQLTGGVAHDFNNLLQVILGNLQIATLLLERKGAPTPGSEMTPLLLGAIEKAQKSSRSAAQLVQRLLAFSRQQRLDPSPIDTNALIADMAEMIRRTLGETIEVRIRLAPVIWPALVDKNQLETALLNLVLNARDAMAEGGALTIETVNLTRGTAPPDDLVPGDYVLLSVSDTGSGIPAEIVARVFEPFFTTKDTGKGSGLGLSMVYGFVRQSGGHVRLVSEVGAGTTVRIYLPRLEQIAAPGASARIHAVVEVAGDLATARPGETILLVEDNEEVRRFGISALERLGYRVLPASDGAGALHLVDTAGAQIDLLFTDIVLPGGMSGRALAEAIASRRPQLPVLFTTGYARIAAHEKTAPLVPGRVLGKPYTLESLASNVRRAIDRVDGTSAALPQRPN